LEPICSTFFRISWARDKYSRGAVKIHTLLDLRGSIPSFIFISAFDKSPLIELLTQVQANQNVKEQLNLLSDNF
jgi:hypothetical protein